MKIWLRNWLLQCLKWSLKRLGISVLGWSVLFIIYCVVAILIYNSNY